MKQVTLLILIIEWMKEQGVVPKPGQLWVHTVLQMYMWPGETHALHLLVTYPGLKFTPLTG